MQNLFSASQWKEIKAAMHYVSINAAIFIAMLIPAVQDKINPEWMPVIAVVLNFITYKTQLTFGKDTKSPLTKIK